MISSTFLSAFAKHSKHFGLRVLQKYLHPFALVMLQSEVSKEDWFQDLRSDRPPLAAVFVVVVEVQLPNHDWQQDQVGAVDGHVEGALLERQESAVAAEVSGAC